MLRAITPRFIKKLDAYLLESYPVTWSSKIHFAAWHGLVLGLISLLLGLVLPFDLERRIQYDFWHFIMCLIAFVLACIWTYHYVIFNKEKQFGAKKPADAYLDFLLVFLVLGIFILTPWPLELALSQRVADTYNDKELIQDVNTLNETWLYVVDSDNKYKSWTSTTQEENEFFTLRTLYEGAGGYFSPHYVTRHPEEFPEFLTRSQIAARYNPDIDSAILAAKIQLYLNTCVKYLYQHEYSAEHYTRKFLSLRHKKVIPSHIASEDRDSQASNVDDVIGNVSDAKFHELFFFEPEYFLTLFFVIFSLSILLTLFKLVYWKQYLLLAVVAIFYPILAVIFSEIFPIGIYDRRNNTLQFWLVLFVVASIVSVFFSSSRPYYRPALNILNQAFYALAAFLPLIAVLLLHDHTNLFHNTDYYSYYTYEDAKHLSPAKYASHCLSEMYDDYWHREYQRWLNGCLWTGIALFFLSLPWLKGLFFKQLALPKKA